MNVDVHLAAKLCVCVYVCVCVGIYRVCILQCSEVDSSDGEQIRFPLKAPLCGANGSAMEVNAQ